jgi:nicotinate-nucleotide pyrophosphorylase (carboxylating)
VHDAHAAPGVSDPGHGFSLADLERFLREDVGDGDWTTEWTVSPGARARARIVAKAPGVVSGIRLAEAVFHLEDPALQLSTHVKDGDALVPGDLLLQVEGDARGILRAERTALNLLGRLSGIATLTRAFVEAAASEGGRARITDTRKTTPGWRVAEKTAVRHGGGWNHRMGLHDMILMKENHIEAAGGIPAALARVHAANARGLPVEIEVRSLEELELVRGAPGLDRVLLDNFSLDETREAVVRVRGWEGARPELEASGNMSLARVGAVSATGVDWISVGALTHSAPVADLSLLLDRLPDGAAGVP